MSAFQNFKINKYLNEVFLPLKRDRMVIVQAPTGSGKTLGLPNALAVQSERSRIRVVVPTVIATKMAYDFVSKNTKFQVGYAAGRIKNYKRDDNISYFTTGHLVSKVLELIRSGKLPLPPDTLGKQYKRLVRDTFGDVLMIDETHTATIDISMLVGLMSFLFRDKNRKYLGPRLIMASATTNAKDLKLNFPEAEQVSVGVREYPIEILYNSKIHNPSTAKVSEIDNEIVRIVKEEMDKKPRVVGIVFRPGKHDVEKTIRKLESVFKDKATVVPAYSGLTDDEIADITDKTQTARIIVGTNYIESSVTIPDADFIISDMLEKKVRNSRVGVSILSSELISQASSTQRVGRVGRTKPGRAHLLISEGNYNTLDPYHDREVDRVPLEQTVLMMSGYGLDISTILSIRRKEYMDAVRNLLKRGMMERGERDDYIVTDVGHFVRKVALSISHSHLLYLTLHGDFTDEVKFTSIALVCLLEAYGNGYVYIPRRDKNHTEEEHLRLVDEATERFQQLALNTDVATLVNMFWSYSQYALEQGRSSVGKVSKDWTKLYNINNKRWSEFVNLFSAVVNNLSDMFPELVPYIRGFFSGKLPRNPDVLSIARKIYPTWKIVFDENKMISGGKGKGFSNISFSGTWKKDKYSKIMSVGTFGSPDVFFPSRLIRFQKNGNFSLGIPGDASDLPQIKKVSRYTYVSDLDFDSASESEVVDDDEELIGTDSSDSDGESDDDISVNSNIHSDDLPILS